MKVLKDTSMLHPILIDVVKRIQAQVIDKHNAPIRLFETGRQHDRQQSLLHKGQTQNIISKHLYDLTLNPPLYATAVDYVYYDERWSWNLRNSTVASWYTVFGNMVLDICPELIWGGCVRKSVNFTHFELREKIIYENIEKYPCLLRP